MVNETVVFTCGHEFVVEAELIHEEKWEIENILICPACVKEALDRELQEAEF